MHEFMFLINMKNNTQTHHLMYFISKPPVSPSANQHVNWLAAVFGTPQPGLYHQLPSPQAETMQLPPLAKRTQ